MVAALAADVSVAMSAARAEYIMNPAGGRGIRARIIVGDPLLTKSTKPFVALESAGCWCATA